MSILNVSRDPYRARDRTLPTSGNPALGSRMHDDAAGWCFPRNAPRAVGRISENGKVGHAGLRPALNGIVSCDLFDAADQWLVDHKFS